MINEIEEGMDEGPRGGANAITHGTSHVRASRTEFALQVLHVYLSHRVCNYRECRILLFVCFQRRLGK